MFSIWSSKSLKLLEVMDGISLGNGCRINLCTPDQS
jgi:hypothetical protein